MTTKQAINILIEEACKSVSGAGQGIREEVTKKRQMRVVEACIKVHRLAGDSEPYDAVFFMNRGIFV